MEIDKTNFLAGKEASKILDVHQRTLHYWDKHKKIEVMRAPGGKRFYNVEKYLKDQKFNCEKLNKKDIKCSKKEINNKRKKICYARVSSLGQKNDLVRQKEELKKNIQIMK